MINIDERGTGGLEVCSSFHSRSAFISHEPDSIRVHFSFLRQNLVCMFSGDDRGDGDECQSQIQKGA